MSSPAWTPTLPPTVLSRRTLLRGGAAASALLLARPTGALAAPIGPRDAYGTSRESRLFAGTWVVHTDMHNHSILSDGAGDPEQAYVSMRDAGLDVACLTDHTVTGSFIEAEELGGLSEITGIGSTGWEQTKVLADRYDEPGQFTAIRGFEWSSPALGHINVWASEGWSDPLGTGGLAEDLDEFRGILNAANRALGLGLDVDAILAAVVEETAGTPAEVYGMAGFYDWLRSAQATDAAGRGALFGFNHPGREPGRFEDFTLDAGLRDRMVSLELFNRRDDYLFRVVNGRSPLVACLDAGWMPGIAGVTDEHGTDWGEPDGKGRCGYWVTELTRDGVRQAMLERAMFATVLRGLRLDAAANGVRMGKPLGHRDGTVTIELDIDRGEQWIGKDLVAQVLTTGAVMPTLLAAEPFRVPSPEQPLPTFTIDVDVEDVPWLVLRITDPETPAPGDTPAAWTGDGAAIAYSSPWFLDADLDLPDPDPDPDPTDPDPTDPDPTDPDPTDPDPTDPDPTDPDPTDPDPDPTDPDPTDPDPTTGGTATPPATPVAAEADRRSGGSVTRRGSGAGVPDRGQPLPRTGSELRGPLGLGTLLMAAGGGLLALRRRTPEEAAEGAGASSLLPRRDDDGGAPA